MKTFRYILVVFAVLAFTIQSNAQTAQATMTHDGAVQINTQEPLQGVYILDASTFNFESDQDAISYFAEKNSEFVSYRPVLQNDAIMIYLQIKTRPDWTKSDWNAYFAENKILPSTPEPTHQLTK